MLSRIIDGDLEEIRVLHIDDDPNQFEFIKLFLEQVDPALNVHCVATPDEVFHELSAGQYDCLVTDFKMPLMNGIELSSKVREKYSTPIILYTGQGSEEVAESAFTVGIDDYIRKEMDPSHYQVLGKRIRHVVEKKRAEMLYQNVVKGIRDGLCIIVDGKIVYANQKQADLLGLISVTDIIGKKAVSILHPDDRERAVKLMTEEPEPAVDHVFTECRLLRADGTHVMVEILGNMIQYNGKQAILVLCRDLTERNRIEEERNSIQERFRTIIELAPDGICTVSLTGKVTSVNPAFLKLTGYEKDEVLAKRFYKLGSLRNLDLRNNLKVFASIVRGNLPPLVEFAFRYKNGSIGWGEAHLAFIENNGSKELLAIVRDVTERKWVEKEISEYSDEMAKNVIEPRKTDAMQKTISSGSHVASSTDEGSEDPMVLLKNSLGTLRDDPSRLNELLGKMEISVESASNKLNEMYDNTKQMSKEKVDVVSLLEESLKEANIPPEVKVVTEFSGLNHFYMDPKHIKSAVLNLVTNGLTSIPDGGELDVICDVSDTSLVIEVGDSGHGFSNIQIERLMSEGTLKLIYQ